jgi:hypothetical protein
MKLSIGACLGALITLILGTTPPTHGAPAPGPELTKPASRYHYSATFTARSSYAFKHVVDDKGNDVTISLDATLKGSIPRVSVTQKKLLPLELFGLKGGKVRVTQASTWSQVRTNDGANVTTCEGEKAKESGKPTVNSAIFDTLLMPYTGLTFFATCSNTDEGEISPGLYYQPVINADVDTSGVRAGAKSLSLPFEAAWTESGGSKPCPRHDGAEGMSCSYKVSGTLKLKRLDEEPDKGGSRAVEVSPGASTVETDVMCPATCTIIIELTPLKGGPTLEVERLSPKPRKPVTVTIDIPRSKRALVLESGGVTVEVTYKLAGGTSFTDIRTGRV